MSNNRKPNRLVYEKSPYLLQHAHNPVDWYPWGDEAFEKARQEDKPVFLSIGYSTCHWCHVMERESFEDETVAGYLNEHFVAIKVDREERPDIDAVYMRVTQALTGQGGWPMSVFLTPDTTAFYAGTYFPKQSRFGMSGFSEVLAAIVKLWRDDRNKLLRQSGEIIKRLGSERRQPASRVTKKEPAVAFELFRSGFDNRYGGFGPSPKFPTPHNLMFLLRYYKAEHQKQALEMTETTLKSMYRGGLFDHVGGGFSRYSTDDKWLVPHFEKMLYDNALLVLAYLEAYQATKNPLYKRVAEKTLRYIEREMTHLAGGFYSAQDADSEGAEGKYYVWTPGEVQKTLGAEDGGAFCRWFGITETGNFEGTSIPNLLTNEAYAEPNDTIEALLPKLYDVRLSRAKLFKDEKILTAWNALMIAALGKAYWVLGDDKYKAAAERAAAFVKDRLTRPDGRLYVRWHDGEAAGTGYLDDYAYLAWAMLQLYEATADVTYFESALRHAEAMCRLFEDRESGGFFLYGDDSEQLMLRPKETYDGATPSGNAVAAFVLVRLSKLTAEEKWTARAERQLAFLSAYIKEYPAARCFGLMAAMLELYPSKELVVTGASAVNIQKIREALGPVFSPDMTILIKTAENEERLAAAAPFTADYPVTPGKVLYYICENHMCAAPVESLEELTKHLRSAPAKS